jgi:hypothetical protein
VKPGVQQNRMRFVAASWHSGTANGAGSPVVINHVTPRAPEQNVVFE